jgi:hypothetical protein
LVCRLLVGLYVDGDDNFFSKCSSALRSTSVGRSNFFSYGLFDLALPDRSWMVFPDCREEVCPCNTYPGCYIFDNGDSYSWLPSDIDQVVRFIFPEILVLVLLPILGDYSNGCTRVRCLGTAAVTPPNYKEIRDTRYVFHHNPRIIVVVHIT